MSKKHKRRNKPYTGTDAKVQNPSVHRYTAVVRSPLRQWWHDHQRVIKLTATICGGALFVGWLLVEAFHLLAFGSPL